MKKSLLIHFDSLEVLDDLSVEQVGELFLAIRDYTQNKEPNLKGLMKAVFTPFKNQFDRDLEKWNEVRIKRSAAGKKSAEVKANKGQQKQQVLTSVDKSQQTATNSTVNVSVNGNVSVNDNVKVNESVNGTVNENVKTNTNIANQDLPIVDVKEEKKEISLITKEKEKKKVPQKKKVELIYPFDDKEFLDKWELWKLYRKEKRNPIKGVISEQSMLMGLSKKANGDMRTAMLIIEQSMENTWTGLFELKISKESEKKRREKAGKTLAERALEKLR